MKTFLFIIVMMLFSGISFPQNKSLDSLTWLEGTWTIEKSKTTIYEKWKRMSNDTFEGISITVNNNTNDTLSSESLRLVKMEESIFYIAKVSHNEFPVSFRMVYQQPNEVIFENAGHDFPQRITYSRKSETTLNAEISGIKNNKENSVVFSFKRKLP